MSVCFSRVKLIFLKNKTKEKQKKSAANCALGALMDEDQSKHVENCNSNSVCSLPAARLQKMCFVTGVRVTFDPVL